ncbi:MFS transporter [Phenylobacterium sp.]|uniref:MFS transporter n=1 Tax=Phenylobacterium sp. TaxID=1871053 RepID=UPI002F3E8555
MTRDTTEVGSAKREVAVIALMTLSKFSMSCDFYIMSLILPSIGRDLHLSQVMVSWVVAAQGLFFAGFMVLAGRLADILGQRRALASGLCVFAVGAVAAALAQNVWWLIAARCLQGLGAAILAPAAFSLITTLLPEGPSRHRALGVFSLTQGLSVIAGLLVAGALVGVFGWRAGFLINVPLLLVALYMTLRIVPKGPIGAAGQKLDVAGAVLITLSTALLLGSITIIGRYGVASPLGLGLLAAAVVGGVAFVAVERRVAAPLAPLDLVRRPSVIGSCLTGMGLIAAGGGVMVVTNFYMQSELKYSILVAGIAILPYAAGILLSGPAVPWLMARLSSTTILIGCVIIAIAGMVTLSFVSSEHSYLLTIAPGLVLSSFGAITAWAGLMNWATRDVPAQQQGVTSGMLLMFQQLGVPLGAAVMLSILGGHAGEGSSVYQTAYLTAAGFATAGLVAALVSVRAAGRLAAARLAGRAAGEL